MKLTKVEIEELYHAYKNGWLTGANQTLVFEQDPPKSPSEKAYQQGLVDGQNAFNAAMREQHRKLTK